MSGTWWVSEDDLLREQLDVLGLGLDEDILIQGPPGSGKTNLLLLRANHLVITRPDLEFFVVCFTRLLTRFIRTGAQLYDFPENRIITKQALYESVLADHGLLPAKLNDMSIEDRATAIDDSIAKMMRMDIGRASFPMLFIDEAQDYSTEDLEIFKYLSNNIACAADGRQGIYSEAESGKTWLANHPWNSSIRLLHHHRTAPNILEVADRIMDGKLGHIPMLPTHQYVGDVTPIESFDKVDINDQAIHLAKKIARQVDIYPGEKIGVIVPRKRDLNLIWDLLCADATVSNNITNAMRSDFDPTKPVWVSTMHSSKGLEFRCVHIVTADKISKFNAHSRRLAFTGVTRAKTALTIYHYDALPPFFAAALAQSEIEKISVKRLFGVKK